MNKQYRAHQVAVISLILLILLCFCWEWFIAPIREGGSWMAIKALPLCLALSGCIKGKIYTFQYMSMFILFYLAEGIMRLWDLSFAARVCALLEIILVVTFFISSLCYVKFARAN